LRSYLHFLPFIFLSLGPFLYYHLRLALAPEGSASPAAIGSQTFINLFYAAKYGLLLIYIILTLATLHKYRKELKRIFSYTERIDLVWLSLIIVAFMLMWLVDLANIVMIRLLQESYSRELVDFLSMISIFINFAFATAIVFKGLRQPNIFSGLKAEQKYGKLRLSKPEVNQHILKLEQFLEQEKLYLNPSLTINDLAESVSIPARQLSQVINDKLKQNFYDFVNSYRINAAIEMFKNPNHDDKTILEILYDVGFNSKSSFNHIFKKKTGETPSQFRKNCKTQKSR
jgi:AraC-like DNA-binding protein